MELERLRAEKMDVDGASPALAEDIPTCGASLSLLLLHLTL